MAASSSLACPSVLVSSAPWSTVDWYAAPLYYDIIFAEETALEAQWLDELFTLFGPLPAPPDLASPPSAPVVLEPACGSGRLLHALLLQGYRCIGFDRQPAAVQFARARCKAAIGQEAEAQQLPPLVHSSAASTPAALLHQTQPPPPPPCCVFEADLTDFASTQPLLVPAASVHMAHCLVSSLKYLMSEQAVMQHFHSVADSLVHGGLYIIALHVCDYNDRSSSVDEHEAEREGMRVAATITCDPPDITSRTEQLHIAMTVTGGPANTASHTSQPHTVSSVQHFRCSESQRTYSVVEVWQLLSALSERRWFDVVATFDYEQARRGKVEEPLEWPQPMQSFDAASWATLQSAAADQMEWTGWQGVEALAVVLRRRGDA